MGRVSRATLQKAMDDINQVQQQVNTLMVQPGWYYQTSDLAGMPEPNIAVYTPQENTKWSQVVFSREPAVNEAAQLRSENDHLRTENGLLKHAIEEGKKKLEELQAQLDAARTQVKEIMDRLEAEERYNDGFLEPREA